MNKKALLIISGLTVLALGMTVLIAMNVAKPGPWANTDQSPGIAVGELTPGTNPSPTPAPEPGGPIPDKYSDMITVSNPMPNMIIESPLMVEGSARGPWYFEASFPVKLLDANGNLLVQTHAQAKGEWMTNDFVPFSAKVEFKKPTTETGTLVLEKDNPSGLPEHDAQVSINVRFTAEKKPAVTGCRPSGCSGQICSDQDMISDCMFRPEYACYKTATCERQPGGDCGWTKTANLSNCLANPPQAQ